MWKRIFRFEKVDVGDLVKFKINSDDDSYSIYYGKVVDISKNLNSSSDDPEFSKLSQKDDHDRSGGTNYKSSDHVRSGGTNYKNGYLGVEIDKNDERNEHLSKTTYIDRRSVLQIYPSKLVTHLTPRIALKHLWKDLVFREVKIAICSNLSRVEYKYISKTGFERVKRFPNLEIAHANVLPEYHRNIVPYYNEYYGFSTGKALRSNDHYYDKEIFFSKKCYCELDWSEQPTGDFMIGEKGFNCIKPVPDTLICGIVEEGEKGLFYRKWMVCSKEFLTLWTMVCEPNHSSLMENVNMIDDELPKDIWVSSIKKKKKKVKDIDVLLNELDTSCYSIDVKADLEQKRKKHYVYNLERAALYYPNRYKQVAEVLFHRGINESNSFSEDGDYSDFQENLVKNLLWSKRVE